MGEKPNEFRQVASVLVGDDDGMVAPASMADALEEKRGEDAAAGKAREKHGVEELL